MFLNAQPLAESTDPDVRPAHLEMTTSHHIVQVPEPSYISALPSEVLETIFLCCVDARPPPPALEDFTFSDIVTPQELAYPHNLFTLTHVCQLWRSVALGSSRLWARIVPMTHTCTIEVLARSRGAPLEIDFSSRKEVDPPIALGTETIACDLRHLGRTRALSLTFLPGDNFMVEFSQPAPMLQSLSLWECWLPENPFSGHVPLLRHAYLWRVTIRWDSEVLRNVTSLTLSYSSPESGDLHDAILCLESLPSLERLVLNTTLLRLEETSLALKPITLRSLRYLELADSATSIVEFLDSVFLPCSPTLRVWVRNEEITTIQQANVCRAIRSQLSHQSDEAPCVCLGIEHGLNLRVYAYTHIPPRDSSGLFIREGAEARLDLQMDCHLPSDNDDNWHSVVGQLFPTGPVRAVSLHIYISVSQLQFEAFFHTFNSIEELWVESYPDLEFPKSLVSQTTDLGHPGYLVLPRLKMLIVRSRNWHEMESWQVVWKDAIVALYKRGSCLDELRLYLGDDLVAQDLTSYVRNLTGKCDPVVMSTTL
ncbi:hypothetical protein JAAARDRAFT_202223 [Jaapia argillacea MUCL 33604]|uniref:Uncharacterized protein n=1 Tax=Jaapia argillacea MUCL 33604 TaxID=933084 RepID=A0A067QFP7_9AGAM|nr:hypothetical protein JAAARDRAFT_202223 [Jaapia argillacea MUCL 33604]